MSRPCASYEPLCDTARCDATSQLGCPNLGNSILAAGRLEVGEEGWAGQCGGGRER
jgi:hypothetical protein